MQVVNIFVIVLLVGVVIRQLYFIKDIIIPSRKGIGEIILILTSVVILSAITYFYASLWYHYIVFILGLAAFISICLKEGISSIGFLVHTRGKDVFYWREINKVKIVNYEDKVKLILSGCFSAQIIYFKKSDLSRIVRILKKHGKELNFGEI